MVEVRACKVGHLQARCAAAGLQRLTFPDFHSRIAHLRSVLGTDVEPLGLVEPNNP